jgi:hypothetical protein
MLKPIMNLSSYPEETHELEGGWLDHYLMRDSRFINGFQGRCVQLHMMPAVISGEAEDFPFVGEMAKSTPRKLKLIQEIMKKASKVNITLPEYFIRFMSSGSAQESHDKCAQGSLDFDISTTILTAPEDKGYLIQFLTDIEAHSEWYLFVNKKSEHCILNCLPCEEDYGERSQYGFGVDFDISQIWNKKSLCRCSPSIEDFLHRLLLESKCLLLMLRF